MAVREVTATGASVESPRGERPAPAVRRAIIEALGEAEGGLTVREAESRVGTALGRPHSGTVEDEIEALTDWGLVTREPGAKKLTLTDAGRRFLEGLRAQR